VCELADGSALGNRHRHHAIAAAAGRARGQTTSGRPKLGRAALRVHVNPLGLPHPSAAAGARRAAPPRCRHGEAAAVRPARMARGPWTVAGHAMGGHRCASPPCSSRAAPPPPGHRQPPAEPSDGHPPSLLPPGKKEIRLSLSLSECMASGPNCEVGPACRLCSDRSGVGNRVCLANIVRVVLIPNLNFRFHLNLQKFISHARKLQK
jgi:hypothetical protein